MNSPLPQPAIFVSHGSPMLALDHGPYAAALKAELAGLNPRPKAVLVVSAHWLTGGGCRVTSANEPGQLYDFGGFPDALYRVRYAAQGAPELAARVAALLQQSGFRCELDPLRGLDHGAWVPLHLAMPDAELPVLQLSLPNLGPLELLDLGAALQPLRNEGVLLMGSGSLTHNLSRVRFDDEAAEVEGWAHKFDHWMWQRIVSGATDELVRYRELPEGPLAHPTSEHLHPLFVVLGSAFAEDKATTIFEGFQYGTLSLRSFELRPSLK